MATDTKDNTGLSPKQEPAGADAPAADANKTASSKATQASPKKTSAKPESRSGAARPAKAASKTASTGASSKTAKRADPNKTEKANAVPAASPAPVKSSAAKTAAKKTSPASKNEKTVAAAAQVSAPIRDNTSEKNTYATMPETDLSKHTAQVEFLAITLFRELASMHNLGETWEKRLRLAARFHDLGWREGREGHHKASMRIIEKEDLGIAEADRPFVALLARYHRKAWPSLKHKRFAALCGDDRAAVRALAAILRVADGLDYTHGNVIKTLALRIRESKNGKRRAVITLTSEGDASAEIARALKKGDLFEDVFHMELRVSCPNQ